MNPLLLPLIAWQGARVRRRTEVLPPASGPTQGVTAIPSKHGLRLTVLGESTAAGCGVDSHEQGFAGHLARRLVEQANAQVLWQVVGQHGATARRIRYRLLPRTSEGQDCIVLLAGVNDVLSRRAPSEWAEDMDAIVADLVERSRAVVVAGIPAFGTFPSLPRTLRAYLDRRARALDEVTQQVCASHPRVTWLDSTTATMTRDHFARDGFHPSEQGYREWATSVAECLRRAAPTS